MAKSRQKTRRASKFYRPIYRADGPQSSVDLFSKFVEWENDRALQRQIELQFQSAVNQQRLAGMLRGNEGALVVVSYLAPPEGASPTYSNINVWIAAGGNDPGLLIYQYQHSDRIYPMIQGHTRIERYMWATRSGELMELISWRDPQGVCVPGYNEPTLLEGR